MNCTVEVLPPRNFSQPGAPDDEITKISTKTMNMLDFIFSKQIAV